MKTMKTGAVLVLVAFLVLGMDMAYIQGELEKPGLCPTVPAGVVGICVEQCSGDDSCPKNLKCCSTGCGHRCLYPVI